MEPLRCNRIRCFTGTWVRSLPIDCTTIVQYFGGHPPVDCQTSGSGPPTVTHGTVGSRSHDIVAIPVITAPRALAAAVGFDLDPHRIRHLGRHHHGVRAASEELHAIDRRLQELLHGHRSSDDPSHYRLRTLRASCARAASAESAG